jgi:hypothetical protein
MVEPLQVSADNSHRRRGHAWNPASLTKCCWLDLAEPLNHLTRQPGDSLIREAARDRPGFVALGSFHVRVLAFEIPVVFDDGFGRGDVVKGAGFIDIEGNLASVQHL